MTAFTTVTVKTSKTKTKRLTAGKKSGRNLIYRRRRRWSRTTYGRYLKRLKMLPSESEGDAVSREFQNLERLNPHIAHRPSSTNLRSKSPAGTAESSSSPRSGNENACNFDFSAYQNVGKSRLCDRSRSSAIIWKPALNDSLDGKL